MATIADKEYVEMMKRYSQQKYKEGVKLYKKLYGEEEGEQIYKSLVERLQQNLIKDD